MYVNIMCTSCIYVMLSVSMCLYTYISIFILLKVSEPSFAEVANHERNKVFLERAKISRISLFVGESLWQEPITVDGLKLLPW